MTLAVLYASTASAQPLNIDLPSQEAAKSIPEFGRQANVQIIAPVTRLRDVRTPAVKGHLEVREALDQLLAGTGLEVASNDGKTIVLRLAAPVQTGSVPIPPPEAEAPLDVLAGTEVVTVTGSRLITDAAISPTPVAAMTKLQLQSATPSDLPDALNKLPMIFGGRTPRTQGNGSANNAGNVLALRGFGAARTLVLLDGHRVVASNQDGTVNIDTLPQTLLSRVDIVTGGASAVYGSDAVAGVVNFALDTSFTGLKYDINAGISKYEDAAEWQIDAASGAMLFGGRGHFELAGRYRNQDMVPISARPYGYDGQAWLQTGAGTPAAPFVNTPYARTFGMSEHGTVSCGTACTVNNYTFNQAGVLSPMIHGVPTTTSNLESGGAGGYVKYGTFSSKVRMAEGFGRFDYDLAPQAHAYIQAMWEEAGNWADWENWVVSSAANRPNTFFANNPFLNPSTQAQLGAGIVCGTLAAAGWRCLAPIPLMSPQTSSSPPPPPATPYFSAPSHAWSMIGGRDAASQNRVYSTQGLQRHLSIATGLSGVLESFFWDLYYSHGESRLKVTNPNNTDNAKYLASLDAVIAPPQTIVDGTDISGTIACWVTTQPQYASLYPGCVPANLFDPNGPSPDSFDYVRRSTWWTLTQAMDDVEGSIHGGIPGLELPAGAITVAISGEERWETYKMESKFLPTDYVDCTGLRMCLANGAAPVRWVQNVNAPVRATEKVAELAVELNVPLVRNVPAFQNLSLDLAGRITDYSTSGSAKSWKLGTGWQVDDLIRLRGTMSVDIRAPNLNDLYQPSGISTSGFTDLLTGGSRSTQLILRGDPELKPETAQTYTVGATLTPKALPNFSLSIDGYKTHLTKAITNISYQSMDVQNVCLASAPAYDSPFCALAERPIADPSDPNYRSPNLNFPTRILSSPLNAAQQELEGVDVEVGYAFELRALFGWLSGSVKLRHFLTYQPVNTTISIPGGPPTWSVAPKVRQTSFLEYSEGAWTLSLENEWLSGLKKASSDNNLNGNTQNYSVSRLNAYDVLDATIAREFDLWGGRSQAYFSVSNIGNTRAPLLPSTTGIPDLFYPTAGFYNDMGRYFTLGVRGNL